MTDPDDSSVPARRVAFRTFESGFQSWDVLFGEAADFASTFTPANLISISHSHEGARGVVTVWYWEET